MIRFYRCYGMTLASGIDLPELDETDGVDDADLRIMIEPVAGPMPEGRGDRFCEIGGSGAYFAWNGLARIRIDNWSRIAVAPELGISDSVLAFALLGPVMAAILHGRGDLVLHGSAVEMGDGRAILFVGDNGAGKSTLAGACIKAGYTLVNDDVAAICVAGQGLPHIRSGFPALKLSRPALAALGPMPGVVLPSAIPDAAKVRLRLPRIDESPLRLVHIFLLRRGETTEIRSLGPTDRLGMMIRYSYMPKLGPDALGQTLGPQHFRSCVAVAHATPASLLHIPDRLDTVADAIAQIADRLGVFA